MKLEKAIEILADIQDFVEHNGNDDVEAATKLGIEALKKLQIIRGYPHYQWKSLLPGETQK